MPVNRDGIWPEVRERQVCPELPEVAEPAHWSMPDPAADPDHTTHLGFATSSTRGCCCPARPVPRAGRPPDRPGRPAGNPVELFQSAGA